MKCLILFARPYSFKDDSTGRVQSGMSVSYLSTNSLAPYVDAEGGFYGYQPIKDSVSHELVSKIVDVPGVYDIDVMIKPGQDGRAIMRITDLKFVSAFK